MIEMVIMELKEIKSFVKAKDIVKKVELERPGITQQIISLQKFQFDEYEKGGNYTKIYLLANFFIRILDSDRLDIEDLNYIEKMLPDQKFNEKNYQILTSAFKRIIDQAVENEKDLKVLIRIMRTTKLYQNSFKLKKGSFQIVKFQVNNSLLSTVLAFSNNPNENLAKLIIEAMMDLKSQSYELSPYIEILSLEMINFFKQNFNQTKSFEILNLLSSFLKLTNQEHIKSQLINLKNSFSSTTQKNRPQHLKSNLNSFIPRYSQISLKTKPFNNQPPSLNNPAHFIKGDSTSSGIVLSKLLRNDSKVDVIIKFFQNFRPEALENIYKELKLYQFLSDHREKYPNFLECFEIQTSDEKILMILEHFKTNLSDFIQSHLVERLEESQLRMIFLNLLKSFEFMAKFDIFHLNISLENILIDPNWFLKITNFRSFNNHENSTFDTSHAGQIGFFQYYSIEDFEQLSSDQMFLADVRALGFVFLQLALFEVFSIKNFQFSGFFEIEIQKMQFGWVQILLKEMITAQNVSSYHQLIMMVEE